MLPSTPRYGPWLLFSLCVAFSVWLGTRPPYRGDRHKLVSPLGSGARNTVMQDLNGDGRLDLAIAEMDEYHLFNNAPETDTSAVSIWLSESSGELRRHALLRGLHANLLVGGDLDQDGDVDLITGDSEGDHLTILLNDGQANYRRAGQLVAQRPHNLALGDMDNDGDLDLVLPSIGCAVTVGYNTGKARFRFVRDELGSLWPEDKNSGQPYADRHGQCPRELALADVDRDGDLDIVTFNDHNARESSTLSVITNGGHGKLEAEELVWATDFVAHLTIGDMNGDTWPDLVMSGLNRGGGENIVYILLNDKTGRYGTANVTLSGLNNGEGIGWQTLSRMLDMGKEYVWRGALGDVDRDGDLDLLVLDSYGHVHVRRNRGNASFDELTSLINQPVYQAELAVADIDDDGWLEWLLPRPAVAGPRRPEAAGDKAVLSKLR